jgi:hypothetical protein
MKKTMILETLVVAAALAAPTAKATPIPLTDATISATYNGSAGGMLGIDGLMSGTNSNSTRLDAFGGVEFLSSDSLFGFDFSDTGALTVMANGYAVPSATYRAIFDFGNTLPLAITGFSLTGSDSIAGVPTLSVLDSHRISIDFSNVTWNADFASFTAQLDSAPPAAVPEPGSIALVLAGLAGLVANRRTRARRA